MKDRRTGQKRKEEKLTLTRAGGLKPDTTCTNLMRKHFQKTHVTEAEMCEIHTRRAKDSLTESEGEHSNTHV